MANTSITHQENLRSKFVNVSNLKTETDMYLRRLDQETTFLAKLMPDLAWSKIMDLLSKSNHYNSFWNMFKSCPYYRNLFLSNRKTVLFPQVWKILGGKYEVEEVIGYDAEYIDRRDLERPIPYWKESMNFPYFLSICKLREVCHLWRQGIDSFYENHYMHYKFLLDTKSPKDLCWYQPDCEPEDLWLDGDCQADWIKDRYTFEHTDDKIKRILPHFSKTHSDGLRNPILGRSFSLGFRYPLPDYQRKIKRDCITKFTQLENDTLEVLEKLGHHIWYLNLYFDDFMSATEIRFFDLVRKLCAKLSNLKCLRLSYNGDIFRRRFRRGRFPTLEKLEFISFDKISVPFFNEIIDSNKHIKYLEVKRMPESFEYYNGVLQNLKVFGITLISIEHFKQFIASNDDWKLEKLEVLSPHVYMTILIDWLAAIKCIEYKWANTLTSLIFDVPDIKVGSPKAEMLQQCINLRFNLPNVHTLRLCLNNMPCLAYAIYRTAREKLADRSSGQIGKS